MKIIFLDIDGVLNCSTSQSRCGCFIGIDDKRVKLLKHIIECTGAKIVLISSWKQGWCRDYEDQDMPAQYLTRKLRRHGLHIIDRTYDHIDSSHRGTGIKNWLAEHPSIESWVVLDDEIFPDYEEQGILHHLVKSSFYEDGLYADLAEQAINMLEETK